MDVGHEINLLKDEIKRLGEDKGDGSYVVTFGTLFHDDKCANLFEALVGTLKAAKKQKIVDFKGELLLSPMHDSVEVILKPE